MAERDLGAVSVGQPVIVRARSYPGREFAGKISVIYPQVNKDTRTARIRIELSNPDFALLPDMYVDAEIDTGNPQAGARRSRERRARYRRQAGGVRRQGRKGGSNRAT